MYRTTAEAVEAAYRALRDYQCSIGRHIITCKHRKGNAS